MKKLNELDLYSKEYIIFDLDGTLIDSIGIWNITDYRIIKYLGNKEIVLNTIQKEREKFLEQNTGSDIYLEYCNFLIQKYHLNITKEELRKLRHKLSNEYLAQDIEFKPDAVKLIKELKRLGFTLILATATTKEQLDVYCDINKKMYSQIKIPEYFDLIITKEDVKHKKPNPEIYLYILKHYNTTPDKCIIFEDSIHGITAAKSANIETINVYDKYSDGDRKEINKLTDYAITNYKEFLDIAMTKTLPITRKKQKLN